MIRGKLRVEGGQLEPVKRIQVLWRGLRFQLAAVVRLLRFEQESLAQSVTIEAM